MKLEGAPSVAVTGHARAQIRTSSEMKSSSRDIGAALLARVYADRAGPELHDD